ncbi:MAG: hypothetical protein AD742_11370 [Methylibium sp. NZG]|nr:MAG: hypothetical protein AD742_11370 [Methylibium sp. NZG]
MEITAAERDAYDEAYRKHVAATREYDEALKLACDRGGRYTSDEVQNIIQAKGQVLRPLLDDIMEKAKVFTRR